MRTSSIIKGLIELGLFLELRGPNLAPYYLGLRGLIQALYYVINSFG